MAKSKKATQEPVDDKILFDSMPGADKKTEEDAEGFQVDMNFEEPEISKEGEENEEESETELTTTPEEMEEKAGQQEETEEVTDAESPEEETMDAESNEDTQQPVPTDEGDVNEPKVEEKAPMVPKSRLDEVIASKKALQKQLDEIANTKQQEEVVPDYDFAQKETEYQELVLNGETEKAAELRNDMRKAEKAQMMEEVRQEMGSTVQQNQDLKDLQQKANDLMEQYPMLDENNVDYNQELQSEVLELRDAFVSKGYVPADALGKATTYVMGINAPVTTPNVEPVKDTRLQETKQKAQVTKKLEASKAQPPTLQGEGVNAKKDAKLDLNTLSTEEFNALPDETLKRMRGDFG